MTAPYPSRIALSADIVAYAHACRDRDIQRQADAAWRVADGLARVYRALTNAGQSDTIAITENERSRQAFAHLPAPSSPPDRSRR